MMQSPTCGSLIRCRCAHPHCNDLLGGGGDLELDESSFVHSGVVDAGTHSQINPSNTPFTLKPGRFNVYLIKFTRRESAYEFKCCLKSHYITSLHYYLKKTFNIHIAETELFVFYVLF